LRAANIDGTVEYMLSNDETGLHAKHIFKVTGVKVPVCSVHYTGSAAVREEDLIAKSKVLFDNDFSREAASAFPQFTLLPIYRDMGRLRAQITFETAKVVENDSCKNGVALTYVVDEGDIYTWAGSEWTGNNLLNAADLDRALGFRTKEVAGAARIDKAFMRARELYWKQGYITVVMKPSPVFNDEARSVVYRIGVSEGQRYKMGNLSFTGFSEADTAKLKGLWKLQPGDIYDGTYFNQYIRAVMRPLTEKRTVDKDRLMVDVEIKAG
jgi:outer membrane protein assembly factor BamA